MSVAAQPLESRRIDALVIGASAGGVDALLTLLPHLNVDIALPVFVVVHLGRQQPSYLAQILDRKCAVTVKEAIDKEPALPGTVYVAPPDYHMLVERGPCIGLSTEDVVHHSRPSVDVLFESAADVFGATLFGVILTGANEDGAQGLQAIQVKGGTTMVQRPETAHAPRMAEAALQRVTPDYLLTLEEIGTIFQRLGRNEKKSSAENT